MITSMVVLRAAPQYLWLTSPALFGSRNGSAHLTTARAKVNAAHSESVMRNLGIPIIDMWALTQSRWDASTDGVTFGGTTGVEWMMSQVVLNALFPACTENL